jgi:ABC-type nitrate/sulfonate/bicarbonate transport system substrate-binding protein
LKTALEKVGLVESDITIVPVSFSAMAQSLQSGRIDVGQFPQPFDALLRKQAKVTKIFTAKDAIPEDEELLVLIAKDRFLKSNTTAVKALLEDLTAATKFYLEKPNEARQILLDSKMVRIPSDIFLSMDDYYRDPSMRVDVATLVRMQNYQVKAGFQKKTIDVQSLVDMSYLPH